MRLVIAAVILACPASLLAQRFEVKIVDRQSNATEYTYIVPGHFNSQSNSSANCNGNDSYVNCNGSTTTNGYSTPARQVSYHVRGATFTLHCRLGDLPLSTVKLSSQNALRGRQATTGVVASHSWMTFRLIFMVTRRN